MELPIDHKDLDTIVQSLALGGDARLYHLLKGIRDDGRREDKSPTTIPSKVQIYSESDEYQCKHNDCDI
tara:strand:+ start:184 stop:390 length:207 start_codon:yes stop_codon:yes gene_type:complete